MSETESKRKPRKIANKWDPASEHALLDLWVSNMNRFLSCRKNSHILLEMELELEEAGFNYKVPELKTKMHNMSAKFRRERKLFEKTGVPSDWEHYEAMKNVMSLYKSGCPDVSPDDEEYGIIEENEWKPDFNDNSNQKSEIPSNDNANSDIEYNLNLEDLNQNSDVVSTNISFVSVPGNQRRPINSLSANPATKKVKTTPSSIMGIEGKDDIDLFFLTMAKTVRKLPYHEQVNIKQTVSNIVFEAELKNISNNSS